MYTVNWCKDKQCTMSLSTNDKKTRQTAIQGRKMGQILTDWMKRQMIKINFKTI